MGFICQALSCCLMRLIQTYATVRYDSVKQITAVMLCLTYFPNISLKGPRRNMKCYGQEGQTMAKQRKNIHDMLLLEVRIHVKCHRSRTHMKHVTLKLRTNAICYLLSYEYMMFYSPVMNIYMICFTSS